MMKRKEIIIGLLVIIVSLGALAYYYKMGNSNPFNIGTPDIKADKTNEEVNTQAGCFGGTVNAVKTWELPPALKEISGITWIDQDRCAAIQDNDGIIFIYNFKNEKIEKEIKFGDPGDYEGIALVNKIYYVMRSDGYMYEINEQGKILNQYDLPLSEIDNIESFYFDAPHNRFLIGQKTGDKNAESKHVYAFDLASRSFNPSPVFSLHLADPVLSCEPASKKEKKKKKKSELKPSEITIDPKTKDIYIADGPNQRILVLSADAKPKYFLSLDKKLFPQVEGMMFSPDGNEFYISTEGVKNPANISRVSITVN